MFLNGFVFLFFMLFVVFFYRDKRLLVVKNVYKWVNDDVRFCALPAGMVCRKMCYAARFYVMI